MEPYCSLGKAPKSDHSTYLSKMISLSLYLYCIYVLTNIIIYLDDDNVRKSLRGWKKILQLDLTKDVPFILKPKQNAGIK